MLEATAAAAPRTISLCAQLRVWAARPALWHASLHQHATLQLAQLTQVSAPLCAATPQQYAQCRWYSTWTTSSS
jgi:hypothetical protein